MANDMAIVGWTPAPQLTDFERSWQQLAAEERRARQLAQQEVLAYQKLLHDMAAVFMARELDALRRARPDFPERATSQDWQQLLADAKRARVQWQGAGASPVAQPTEQTAAEHWRLEATRLAAELARTRQELQLAHAGLLPPGARPAGGPSRTARPGPRNQPSTRTARPPAPSAPPKPALAPSAHQERLQAVLATVPTLQPEPPRHLANEFGNWERESFALALLGVTGYAMRQALHELLARRFGISANNARSLRTITDRLAANNFTVEENIPLSGVRHVAAQPDSVTHVVLVRLSDRGRRTLQSMGITPNQGEWDILVTRHGGPAQNVHAAQVCVYAYHARRHGYTTTVCPEVPGPSQPDLLLEQNGAQLYVEVEAGSGTEERRLAKWRNMLTLQGQVALCALNRTVRATLINEAKAAGAEHGRATDLQTLFDTQEDETAPLWAYQW